MLVSEKSGPEVKESRTGAQTDKRDAADNVSNAKKFSLA